MRFVAFGVVLAVVLLASVSAASTFSATVTPQKDEIFPDEVAYFTLRVFNTGNASDSFTVSTPEFDWILDTTTQIAGVASGESFTTFIELVPKPTVPTGSRLVRVKVRSLNTNEFEELRVPVSVLNPSGNVREYVPSIFLNAQLAPVVDAREGLTLSVYLRNRNARAYNNTLQVHIESPLFVKDYTTSLGGIGADGEKTNQLSFLIDAQTPPGEYPLSVRLSVDNTTVNEYRTQFAVAPFTDIEVSTARDASLFKSTTTYTVVNNGNVEDEHTITHATSLLRRIFTTSDAQYAVEQVDGTSVLAFTVPLGPHEEGTVSVTENFRLLAILILVVILSVVAYFLFRSPLVLRKEASIVGSKDDVSQLKIRLFVKNRSTGSIHNVHIVDRVTSMADVVKQPALGTLQPTKVVKKKGHGTLVRWDVDALEAFEERIITYTVRTELKLVGDVYLPAFKAKFDSRGRERTTYSNEVNIPREN